jgi:methionyl aminopeptidase
MSHAKVYKPPYYLGIMILSGEDIDKAKMAGKIASKAIIYGRSLIKPGEKIVDVLDKIEDFIKENGGKPAFPAQVAINEVAAHSCPLQDDTSAFNVQDMIKLDLGVHMDGIIADNAITILFKDNPQYESLLNIKKASEEALANVLKIVAPGRALGEMGLIIQETIERYELSPVKNLSGHGLGKYSVHESPTVPNFNTNDKTELEENQLIAIEPFSTNGAGKIYESSNPTVYSLNSIKPVRHNYTRDILKEIKDFNGLPFTTRWLTRKNSAAKVSFALTELRNLGAIHSYPPLIEMRRGIVSQSEHTVIVRENPIITTNRDE